MVRGSEYVVHMALLTSLAGVSTIVSMRPIIIPVIEHLPVVGVLLLIGVLL